jgi:hypothetical protein
MALVFAKNANFFRRKLKKSQKNVIITSTPGCDHNFLRFSTIFGEKIGVFLKNQRYDQIFA